MILVTAAAAVAVSSSSCTSDRRHSYSGSGNNNGGDDTSGAGGSGGNSAGAGGQGGGGVEPGGPCAKDADCAAVGDACNRGSCVVGKCVKLADNEGAACSDGKQCTLNDVCEKGACVGGSKKSCPSSSPCMVGDCDVESDTCIEIAGNDGSQCDDGDACTQDDFCTSGVCAAGGPTDCSFLDSICGTGVCDPQLGCKALPSNENASCDDGQFCTVNDKCKSGTCTGSAYPCAPPASTCQVAVCNEAIQGCVAAAGNNGAACDDANGCTTGTTCSNGVCGNPMSQIVSCINGDSCCPAGCANDSDCVYWASGVQQNVPAANLKGWTQCYSATYDDKSSLSTVLANCDKAKLLMACRPVGSASFTLLAMAPRVDVLYECGQTLDCTKQSNGVGWYYNNSSSWGFAPGGQSVNRNSCDYNAGGQILPELRLCWHTSGGAFDTGYRCGDNDLNFSTTWERVVYEAN